MQRAKVPFPIGEVTTAVWQQSRRGSTPYKSQKYVSISYEREELFFNGPMGEEGT
jgi:hypothetical protein